MHSPEIKIQPFDEELHSLLSTNSNVASRLINYIKKHPEFSNKLGMSCLIEEDYIDKDYLIDYSMFYSRCFSDIGRKTRRIHFFNTKPSDLKSRIEKIYNNSNLEKEILELNKLYFGFIVKKPTPNGSIGRSVMKKYPSNANNGDERHLEVYCLNHVNIHGIALKIESLPYQEQDHAVSACATISIWTALKALEEKFHTSLALAPSEITNFAYESSSIFDSPRFPNDGLNLYQMVNVFAKLGYEVIVYELNKICEDKQFIQDIIMGYLSYGLPIIASLDIHSKNGEIDGHATVISGYRLNGKKKISQLYVHDDQITAYSSVEFKRGDFRNWRNDWCVTKGYKKVTLDSFLIPLYHKIRLPFTFIYTKYIKDFRKALGQYGCVITPLLRDVNLYKQEIIKELLPTATLKDEIKKILIKPLPRYFWIIRVSTNDGAPLVDLLLDATHPIVNDPVYIPFHDFSKVEKKKS